MTESLVNIHQMTAEDWWWQSPPDDAADDDRHPGQFTRCQDGNDDTVDDDRDLIEGWAEDGKMIADGLTEGRVMTGFVWESKLGAARLGVLPNEVGSIKMPGLG